MGAMHGGGGWVAHLLWVGEAMIVADSITIFVGSAVRTRWGAKPSADNRLSHVQRTRSTQPSGSNGYAGGLRFDRLEMSGRTSRAQRS